VDLRNPTRVVAVVTQGLNYPGTAREWVTSYKISYGNSTTTTSMHVIQDESGSDLVSILWKLEELYFGFKILDSVPNS